MLLLAISLVPAAAQAPAPVAWDTLNRVALQAWEDGPGRSALARVEGATRAARRVPVGPVALDTEAQLGLPEQRQLLVAARVPLASGIAERRYRAALREGARVDRDLARSAFIEEVQEAWRAWWVAAELHTHLEHWTETVEEDLGAFELAVERGLLAPLALEDLRAESLQVRAEAVAMEQEQLVAAARLRGLLGDVELHAGDHPFHEPVVDTENPWTPLLGRADALPVVRRASLVSRTETRRARSLAADRLPTLSGGRCGRPTTRERCGRSPMWESRCHFSPASRRIDRRPAVLRRQRPRMLAGSGPAGTRPSRPKR